MPLLLLTQTPLFLAAAAPSAPAEKSFMLTKDFPSRPDTAMIEVRLNTDGHKLDLSEPAPSTQDGRTVWTYAPAASSKLSGEIRLTFSHEGTKVAVSCDWTNLDIQSVRLLENVLWASSLQKGYFALPVREGLLVPADAGKTFTHTFGTYEYEGLHMRMLGLVKNGHGLLLTWDDPYLAVDLRSRAVHDNDSGGQILSGAIVLRKTGQRIEVQPLEGDYVALAKAYRQVAQSKGLLETWDSKIQANPDRAKLIGAANVKLWSCLSRQMNEDSSQEVSHHVAWTFDEAAAVAEHLKNDLKLDHVLFGIGGWVHRGYDNQHPDVLPAAPECGGDPALADCAARVMKLGYLLAPHDNYQDMYRDSPSWNEGCLAKDPSGKIVRGGRWAGGHAYLTCASKALELAQRPQNLPAVHTLTGANAYFIDTTFASGLQECFDPAHPLDRRGDMKCKQALGDYVRKVFGIFGSEDGREWAVAHSDFFEGLAGVSGKYLHNPKLMEDMGAVPVPLFEAVYRDCIAAYGKYSYDLYASAPYVLQHLVLGRPLNYHSMGEHLYWKTDSRELQPMALWPEVASFQQTAPRKFSLSYRWSVGRTPIETWRIFVHFVDANDKIRFQNDHDAKPPLAQWKAGQVDDGPFTVAVPAGLEGQFEVRVGLYQKPMVPQATLQANGQVSMRPVVGQLTVQGDSVTFVPAKPAPPAGGDPAMYVRGDGGWGHDLVPGDRFLKNTYEILGPLHELTARMTLTAHEFLTPDRTVQRSTFGQGPQAVTVVVNAGSDFEIKSPLLGDLCLPTYGFVVEGPTFAAFVVTRCNGLKYDQPALFTLRSSDGKGLAESTSLRVYHGFGDPRLLLGGKEYRVETEQLLTR